MPDSPTYADLPATPRLRRGAVLVPLDTATQLRPEPAHLQRARWTAQVRQRSLHDTLGRAGDARQDMVVVDDRHPAFNLMLLAYLPHRLTPREGQRQLRHTDDLLLPPGHPRTALHPLHPLHPHQPGGTAADAAERFTQIRPLISATQRSFPAYRHLYRTPLSAAQLLERCPAGLWPWTRRALHATKPTTVILPDLALRHHPGTGTLHLPSGEYLRAPDALLLLSRHAKTPALIPAGPGTTEQASHALRTVIPASWHVQLHRAHAADTAPTHLTTWPAGQSLALHVRLPVADRRVRFFAPVTVPAPPEA